MSEWISIKDKTPDDDLTVFVINSKVTMLPAKAYYCEEWNEFLSLEGSSTLPVSITHWMPLPVKPKSPREDKYVR